MLMLRQTAKEVSVYTECVATLAETLACIRMRLNIQQHYCNSETCLYVVTL